ncbi:DUF6364 family protein [Parabacteroides sp. ZJ-118]|uniref:DUF6364 family protein n=1 Tax=Parabacteroides sp. ZJ-118 TaxID=2709398 RepID=UPI0013E9A81E|nr:DUF6364 family protein [Parabacteroides sp. ZJ-118]
MKGNSVLNIDEHTLREAFDYARIKGIDLSDMVEKFLLKFISGKEDRTRKIQVSDEVRALAGILSSDKNDKSWRERKSDCLESKYRE